jgi:hypothetical protein
MEFKYKEWMENAGKLVRKIPLTHRDKNGTREEVSTGRLEIIRKELGLYAAETLKLLPEIIEEFRTVGRNLYTVKEYIEEQNTLAKEFDRLSQFEFSVDDTKEIQTVLEPKIQELIPINNKIKKSVQEELLLVEKMRKEEEYLKIDV